MASGRPEARESMALAGGLCRARKSVPFTSMAQLASSVQAICFCGSQFSMRTDWFPVKPNSRGEIVDVPWSKFVKIHNSRSSGFRLIHSIKGGRLERIPVHRMGPASGLRLSASEMKRT